MTGELAAFEPVKGKPPRKAGQQAITDTAAMCMVDHGALQDVNIAPGA